MTSHRGIAVSGWPSPAGRVGTFVEYLPDQQAFTVKMLDSARDPTVPWTWMDGNADDGYLLALRFGNGTVWYRIGEQAGDTFMGSFERWELDETYR